MRSLSPSFSTTFKNSCSVSRILARVTSSASSEGSVSLSARSAKVASSTDRNSSQFRSLHQNRSEEARIGQNTLKAYSLSKIRPLAEPPSSCINPFSFQTSLRSSLQDRLVAHIFLPTGLSSSLWASSMRSNLSKMERCR